MGRINRADLKKTVYYLKRNGLKKTWYAARERVEEKKQSPYIWAPPSEAELENQRSQWDKRGFSAVFSILVPAYRTKQEYLEDLISSLRRQTYPKWELILADATEDDSVERAVRTILDSGNAGMGGDAMQSPDSRIRYIRLGQNRGIAENTNQALPYATGDYVGLLDHDDVLVENALYEMAAAIETGRRQGCAPKMLYSDEDKCNGDRTDYYEPNLKEGFNLDLLLANNYICHFLVMERELIQKLKFRHEFEGAQDYDLVLRAVAELGKAKSGGAPEPGIIGRSGAPCSFLERSGVMVHIPKVLYHWRCHTGSTAENPQSKRYAYDAGRRAVQDFADRAGWRAKAVDTGHMGFYSLQYEGSLFDSRPDVGAVGGSVVGRRRGAGSMPGNDSPEARSILAGKITGGNGNLAGNMPVAGGNPPGNTTVADGNLPGENGDLLGDTPVADGNPSGNTPVAGGNPPGGSGNPPPERGRGGRGMRVIGGRMAEDGRVFYENLPVNYSGYLHRAILSQDAFAVDIRNIRVRPECRELFRQATGVSYQAVPGTDIFDASVLPQGFDIRQASLEFGRAMADAGYRILYTCAQEQLRT